MRIAVVGSGIAGMTAAHVLSRAHEVTMFEADNRVGGHTHTVAVDEGTRSLPVDTGFIVFNDRTYPNLCRLFDALDVDSRPTDMSFSVYCERSGLAYNGSSLAQLFAQKRNLMRPDHWRMLFDILRFHRDAPRALDAGLADTETVTEFVGSRGYGRGFVERYFLPLGASLWSCPAERFAAFPARFVLEFMRNHSMLQVEGRPVWRTVRGGSSSYIEPLCAPFRERIHLGTPVVAVRRGTREVRVRVADGREDGFDEVVIATHADQCLAIIKDLDGHEREVLGFFPYQDNDVALHDDTGALPASESLRASWNYRVPAEDAVPVSVTYHMNQLQGLDSERDYCVTLNPNGSIRPERVIRRLRYSHPVFIPGRASAQEAHDGLVRRRGISYCGAYWGYGFHEDGVNSALAVAAQFGAGLGG